MGSLRFWLRFSKRQVPLLLLSFAAFVWHRCRRPLARRPGQTDAERAIVAMDGRLLIRAISGVERYIAELIQSLSASSSNLGVRLYTLAPYDLPVPAASYTNVAAPRGWSYFAALFGDLGARKIDIWHLLWNDLEPLVFMPVWFAPKAVVTVHDLISIVWPDYYTPSQRALHTALYRGACRRAQAVIVDSEYTSSDIQKILGVPADKIHVVYLGVDPRFHAEIDVAASQAAREKYGLPELYVLSIGRSYAHKNFPRLIHAMHALRQAGHEKVHLVMAGPSGWVPGRDAIDTAVREVGGEAWIHRLEDLDDSELPALYAGAQVFCFPSLYEGFGLPPLEAMACGTPVVCSDATSLPEVVGDAAIQVDATSIAGLAEALAQVVDNPALHSDLRARGLQRVRQFTWQKTCEETLAVYRHVLSIGDDR